MNIIVHLMFSYHVRKNIREETGVKLNLLGFMAGNILPDITPIFHKHPHYIEDSLNYVITSSKKIVRNSDALDCDSFSYAKRLGIINHYLSDFFCHAHQSHYSKGLKDHLLYEFVMMAKYRKGIKKYRNTFKKGPKDLSTLHFKEWLLEKNGEYNKHEACCIRDVSHAIHAGSLLGRNMVLETVQVVPEEELSLETSATPSGI